MSLKTDPEGTPEQVTEDTTTPFAEAETSSPEVTSDFFTNVYPEAEYSTPESEFSSSEPETLYTNAYAEPFSEFLSVKPEYSATAEPEHMAAEPEYNSTSEPEAELTSPEPESVPEPQAEAWPEPGPNWNEAYKDWGEAWPLHVYLFGIVYILLMLFGLLIISAMFMGPKGQKRSKPTIALNSMISFFGLTRAINLFMDPYSSTSRVPFLCSRMLWSVGYPGLTASFSLVLLILLDTTKMDIAPPKFQKLRNIIFVTVGHLTIVIIVDILVLLYGSTVEALLIFCQLLFVLYGLVLAIGFSYAAFMIRRNLGASSGVKDEQSIRLLRLTRTIYISAFVSFSICITNLYSAVSDFGVFSTKSFIDSWPWWILQTVLRVEEVAASLVVLTIFIKTSPTKTLTGYFAHLCNRKLASLDKDAKNDVTSTAGWTSTCNKGRKIAWSTGQTTVVEEGC